MERELQNLERDIEKCSECDIRLKNGFFPHVCKKHLHEQMRIYYRYNKKQRGLTNEHKRNK